MSGTTATCLFYYSAVVASFHVSLGGVPSAADVRERYGAYVDDPVVMIITAGVVPKSGKTP